MAQVRWTEIADSLRASITQGDLRPGDRLPSEKVVSAQWGVCRMTAHRALSELEREGLVVQVPGIGECDFERPIMSRQGHEIVPEHQVDRNRAEQVVIDSGFA